MALNQTWQSFYLPFTEDINNENNISVVAV